MCRTRDQAQPAGRSAIPVFFENGNGNGATGFSAGNGESGTIEPEEVMQAAWSQVLDVLQAELSGPTFNNYLRHIKPVALRAESLTLSVPSDFVKDWLVRRFAGRIEETLEQFLGRPMRLAFQTSPGVAESSYNNTSANSASTGEILEPRGEPELRAAELQEQEERQKFQRGGNFALPSTSGTSRPPRDMAGLEDFSSSPLNRKYTFENFIVGRSNYVSHAAAWAVANAPAASRASSPGP